MSVVMRLAQSVAVVPLAACGSGTPAGPAGPEPTTQGGYQILHGFAGSDGATPRGGLALDAAGNLFGTAYYGGQFGYEVGAPGSGVLFKISADGTFTALHQFSGSVSNRGDGAFPSGVALDPAGNLYGLTAGGGQFGYGVIFKQAPEGRIRSFAISTATMACFPCRRLSTRPADSMEPSIRADLQGRACSSVSVQTEPIRCFTALVGVATVPLRRAA